MFRLSLSSSQPMCPSQGELIRRLSYLPRPAVSLLSIIEGLNFPSRTSLKSGRKEGAKRASATIYMRKAEYNLAEAVGKWIIRYRLASKYVYRYSFFLFIQSLSFQHISRTFSFGYFSRPLMLWQINVCQLRAGVITTFVSVDCLRKWLSQTAAKQCR